MSAREPLKLWAALCAEGFEEDLRREILFHGLKIRESSGDFFLFEGDPVPLAWARVNWLNVEEISVSSISDAAKKLKPLAKKWTQVSLAHHRRGALILENLRPLKMKPAEFPVALAPAEAGVFALLSADRLVWTKSYDRPNPAGEALFVEDKAAPSRAYLKLWEALSLAGKWPLPGERCIDLGSHPGGWTWVVAKLGAQILSIDRQPLDPSVAKMPGVEFKSGDAFQVTPEKTGAVDWLFSDVICYPDKLLEFVELWVQSGLAKNMICTIKMQGDPDPKVIAKFQELGRVLHLHHNKHEVTWMRLR